jgi:ketosteroid isomerase-like protein
MSQENIAVAHRLLEAWNAGDMETVRKLYSEEVVMRALPGWPEQGPFVGRDAVMKQVEDLRSTWETNAFEIVGSPVDSGDRVATRCIWRTQGQGPPAAMEMTILATLRSGRLHYVEFFWDHAEALEAVGLSE